MTGMQIFATFGLPAIAITGALVAVFVTKRNAARIQALEEAERLQKRAPPAPAGA